MKRNLFLTLFSLTLSACGNEADTRLLILGDSVSIGYMPYVSAALPNMSVTHPDDNCRYSAYTLENVDKWLKEVSPTTITWNNGIWDCTTATYSEPEEYEANLRQIADKLLETKARIFFVTTTDIPVHADTKGYIPGCELERNEIAKSVMLEKKIPVIDLNKVALTINHLHQSADLQDNVHFTAEGYRVLGESLAEALLGGI